MNNDPLHVVCYSGGHSSALVAIAVVARYGRERVVLLNHDIHPRVEDNDIKRFKIEVATFLGLPITYVNHPEWDRLDQFDISLQEKAFGAKAGMTFCTDRLKTRPFESWLANHPELKNIVVYYGFDKNEQHRIQRRASHLAAKFGIRTDFPLAFWEDLTIKHTNQLGISPPGQYSKFKHANCIGCLKAGKQHWYLVFKYYPEIWKKAKQTEVELDKEIIYRSGGLTEMECDFRILSSMGVDTTELSEGGVTFAARCRKILKDSEKWNIGDSDKPCECTI